MVLSQFELMTCSDWMEEYWVLRDQEKFAVSKGWGALGSCSISLSQEIGIGCSTSHAKEEGEGEEGKEEEEKKDQEEFEAS